MKLFLDLGELESGMSRINLANSMSNPSAFPPLPGAANNLPDNSHSAGDFAAARNESKSKQASPADR